MQTFCSYTAVVVTVVAAVVSHHTKCAHWLWTFTCLRLFDLQWNSQKVNVKFFFIGTVFSPIYFVTSDDINSLMKTTIRWCKFEKELNQLNLPMIQCPVHLIATICDSFYSPLSWILNVRWFLQTFVIYSEWNSHWNLCVSQWISFDKCSEVRNLW